RFIRVPVMVGLLHHPGLILRREHRKNGGNLHVAHAIPILVAGGASWMHVAAGPLAGNRGVGVLGRPAAAARLLEQPSVVRLRGLEFIGADYRLARIVAVAVAPRSARRRIVPDRAAAVTAPEVFDRSRAVAAEIARVAPERPVLVEILRGEEIHLERLDAGRGLTVARAADEFARVAAHRRTGYLLLIQIS